MINKELRQRMRDRRAWLLPSLYLLALSSAVTFAYYFSVGDTWSFVDTSQPQGAEVGVRVFLTTAYAQLTLLLLLAPVFSAGSLTSEKEQRTLAGLLTSLLTPADIWWGKFVASLLFLSLLLVSSLPVLSLAFALGGVGPRDVLAVTLTTLLLLASFCAIGIYCSSYFRRSVHATAVSYAVVIALTLLTAVAFSILTWQWQQKLQSLSTPPQEVPAYISIPLFLNPYATLTFSLFLPENPEPWLISMALFAAMGCLSTALTLRNLERSGEQT
jgi:ABC-type transport system involved in multi-copper enzyme maturation permease subunit